MPDFVKLLNRFKRVSDELKSQLKNDLPSDEAEFFEVFGGGFEVNLSAYGKNIYAGLNQDVLTAIHKEVNEKLRASYKETLAAAIKDPQIFDTSATANNAQKQFELKLKESKQALLEQFNSQLAAVAQEFTNPADKKALDDACSRYLDTIGKKYKSNLNQINSMWPRLAEWLLHLTNQESKAAAKNADFIIEQTDPKKLRAGNAPPPTISWRLDKDNLAERLLHIIANLKPGQKIQLVINRPDRHGIITQVGEVGIQYRNPAVAFLVSLIFCLLAIIFNNDVERMVGAFKLIVEQYGIPIDPNDITYTIKQLDSKGQFTVIKEEGPLEAEHKNDLEKTSQELIETLKNINKKPESISESSGDESGYESEEASSDEEAVRHGPRP